MSIRIQPFGHCALHSFYLSAPIGSESLLLDELNYWIGEYNLDSITDLRLQKGGIELQSNLEQGFALNHMLKIPHRILLRLATFKCKDFAKLQHKTQNLPWNSFIGKDSPKWKVSSNSSRLFHLRNIEETLEENFNVFRKGQPAKGNAPQSSPTVLVRFEDNTCTVSIDTSGEHLAKRGYKIQSVMAPLRETLASLCIQHLLKVSQPSPGLFLDPMCGSGTFLGEHFLLRQWNASRSFSYEQFPVLKKMSGKLIQPKKNPLKSTWSYQGLDIDPKCVEASLSNLKQFEITAVEQRDSLSMAAPDKPTPLQAQVLISNPPYNERVKIKGAKNIEQALAQLVHTYQPKVAAFVVKSTMTKAVTKEVCNLPGYGPGETLKFNNNGIPVEFLVFNLQEL